MDEQNVREVLTQLNILVYNLKPVRNEEQKSLSHCCVITGVNVGSARFVIRQAEDLIKELFSEIESHSIRCKRVIVKRRKSTDSKGGANI